jgi:hypothetical protein
VLRNQRYRLNQAKLAKKTRGSGESPGQKLRFGFELSYKTKQHRYETETANQQKRETVKQKLGTRKEALQKHK